MWFDFYTKKNKRQRGNSWEMNENISGKRNGKSEWGGILLLIGVILLGVCVYMVMKQQDEESKVPKDAVKYNAVVAEILSEESVEEYDANNSSIEIYYFYNLLLEYEVDGKEYNVEYSKPKSTKMVYEGDKYYISVSPNDPNKIYDIKAKGEKKSYYLIVCNLAIVGLVFVIFAVICFIKARKLKVKEQNQMYSQMYR